MPAFRLDVPVAFRCDVIPERHRVRVAPVGDLDLGTASELDATIQELRDAGFQDVVLDLRSLTFVDSTGLRLICSLNDEARAGAFDLSLIEGSPEVQRIFDLTGTKALLPFRPATAFGRSR